MSHEHSKHVRELFEKARVLDDDASRALLDKRCGGDTQLRRDVEALLVADRMHTEFLGRPALGEAFNIREAVGAAAEPDKHRHDVLDEGAEPRTDALIGRTIGQYRLVSRIGDGGMGAVYLAERADRTYTKRVAVKLIKRGMDSEAIVRRFEQERQILANLDHPGIARLIDGGMSEDGRPYIVMEYVAGTHIDRYCDENALTINQRIDLFRAVCAAVHTAHQNLVVHRDLKPSNVLVTGEGRVKLLDFGIAKTLDPEGACGSQSERAPATLTLPHERRLTLRYASPEQIAGTPVTTPSDVYSLGVILFELLTGFSPHMWSGTDHESMERAIRDDEPLRPSTAVHRTRGDQTSDEIETRARLRRLDPRSLARRLHGDLDTIILMCLRKDPARRYGSAQQLAEDLRRYQAGLPVVARPDTWRYRTGKFLRRHALAASSAALVVLTLSGLLALSVVLYIDARAAEAATARERDRAVLSEALAEQRHAEAEAKAAIAEAVNRFLNEDLLAAADTTVAGGRDVRVSEVLDSAAGSVASAFHDQPAVEGALRLTIGEAYRSLGMFDEAKLHIERAIALIDSTLGKDHYDTQLARQAHALLLRDWGQYSDAEPLMRSVVESLEQSLGKDDRRTIEAHNHLAGIWYQLGRIEESKALHADVLERCRDLLEERDRLTIEAMSNLAELHRSTGEYEEAMSLLKRAVDISRDVLGKDHRRTLITMNALATLYYSAGQLDEAETMFEEVATRQERILGERHPSTLVATSNLATLYSARGRYGEAEALFERTLELRREVLGEDHPNTLRTMNNLATFYLNQNRFEEATALHEQVYRLRLEKLGADHALTMNSMNSLGRVYRELEQFEDAREIYAALVDIRREILGEHDDQTLTAMHNLAEVYCELGRYEEALELTEFVNTWVAETLPENHWRHGIHIAAQAESLKGLQRYDEALDLFQRAYERYKDTFGLEHSRTRYVIGELAELCERLGDTPRAVEWRAMLHDEARNGSDPSH